MQPRGRPRSVFWPLRCGGIGSGQMGGAVGLKVGGSRPQDFILVTQS